MKVDTFEAIVRSLNDAGVPFIVVGGIAVNAHGYSRTTDDIDIVIRLQPDAIRKAFDALASIGYKPRVPINATGFGDPAQRARWIDEKGMRVLVFHSDKHRETPLDVFVSEPFDFESEYREALVEEVAPKLSVRVLRLAALLKMKSDAGRPQDLADAAELRRIHGKTAHD